MQAVQCHLRFDEAQGTRYLAPLAMLYPRFTICSALPRALQHHCRVCGNSFCDVHSPKRVVAYVAARGSSCERSL